MINTLATLIHEENQNISEEELKSQLSLYQELEYWPPDMVRSCDELTFIDTMKGYVSTKLVKQIKKWVHSSSQANKIIRKAHIELKLGMAEVWHDRIQRLLEWEKANGITRKLK